MKRRSTGRESADSVGQWEAAASLGMSRALTFRRIIFPQAIRIILPPMTNDFIALFKDTSLVSVIAVVELTKQYQILAKSSLQIPGDRVGDGGSVSDHVGSAGITSRGIWSSVGEGTMSVERRQIRSTSRSRE